jgi:hypothetical protein
MPTWGEFPAARPELAAAGRQLLYQFGVGLAFLATVKRDGGPRLHPICPVVVDEGLYAVIIPSPKLGDLARDGRFALHAYEPPDNDDAFYVTGQAEPRRDPGLPRSIADAYHAERNALEAPAFATHELFELLIDACLQTGTAGHADPDARHTVWRAEGSKALPSPCGSPRSRRPRSSRSRRR